MNPDWTDLPFFKKVSRCFLIFFYSLSLVALIFGVPLLIISLFPAAAFDAEDRAFTAGIAGFGIVIFPLSLLWWKININDWKWRYLILGRAFSEPFSRLLTHYGNFPEEVKILKKKCKESYHVSGKIADDESLAYWQSRERDGIQTTWALINALDECCQNQSGFEGFLKRCDSEEFKIFNKMMDKEIPIESYSVYSRLSGIFSFGLNYLFSRVFALCGFSLYDNGLSAAYTEKNKEYREKLKNIYSPILFSYQEEIHEIATRLSSLIKN